MTEQPAATQRGLLSSLVMSLRLSFSMLTRLPMHPRALATERELHMSVMFYPWVGAVLGASLMLIAPWLSELHVPGLPAVLCVALLAAISGGLHLDGWADWFDAIGGGRGDRARMLDIMKDSRIGAHGASALVLLLCAKCVAFNEALHVLSPQALVAIPMCSRAAIVPLVAWMKPARDSGLARAVHGGPALTITCGALLSVVAWSAVIGAWSTLWVLAAALLAAASIGAWARARLGGVTGDVYGAALELAELVALVVAVALRAR